MPMELLLVRRIEKERSYCETVGRGAQQQCIPVTLCQRTDCSATHMARLLAWCQRRGSHAAGHTATDSKKLWPRLCRSP